MISKNSSFLFLFLFYFLYILRSFSSYLRRRKLFVLQSCGQSELFIINETIVCARQSTWNQLRMIVETLLLLPFQMSAVVNVSYELSSTSIRFESQLPVFGEKGFVLLAKEQIRSFPTCKQFDVPVSKQDRNSSFSNHRSVLDTNKVLLWFEGY